MSLAYLDEILNQLRLDLSETEKQELDNEMEEEFGIMGLSHCEKLEEDWEKDRSKIESIIYDYIKRKKKNKQKEILVIAK